jgi:AcrR family transcriptional regulator
VAVSRAPREPADADGGGGRRRRAAPAVTIPVDDPLTALPDTAVRVLQAAQRIVVEKGFSALTLSTVATESGENKAMTRYYFGNKAGLVATLVDALVHDECLASASRMRDVGEDERLDRLVAELQNMSEATQGFTTHFEVFPHVLRDPELRQRMSLLYEWYFDLKLDWLGLDRERDAERRKELRGLGQLLSAVIDGLAMQALIDADRFDITAAYIAFEKLLASGLPDLLGGQVSQGDERRQDLGGSLSLD